MDSNFGGDVLVDPNHGCWIVEEYVDPAMREANDCAATHDLSSTMTARRPTPHHRAA